MITFILALELYLAIKFAIVSTKFGWVGLGGSEVGLVLLTLPKSSRKAALSEIKEFAADAVEDTSAFGDLPYRLQRYFDGEKVSFPDSLDLSGATDFQQSCLECDSLYPLRGDQNLCLGCAANRKTSGLQGSWRGAGSKSLPHHCALPSGAR